MNILNGIRDMTLQDLKNGWTSLIGGGGGVWRDRQATNVADKWTILFLVRMCVLW